MDIRTLKTFVYVAELGSFTRAAQALGYSQSTVSFQIKQLESELGHPLFERVRHTVKGFQRPDVHPPVPSVRPCRGRDFWNSAGNTPAFP